MAKIAFLGMGNMGAPMARCLMKGGHQLTVWNRTPEKAKVLQKEGAILAASPKAAVENAAAIFTMLTDDKASRAVWTEPDGILAGNPAPNAIAIESSTVSNAWVKELAAAATSKGLRFVDCCVAGRPDAAEAGSLHVFTGGEVNAVNEVKEIVKPFSKSFSHFGGVGMGNAFKLIYNVMGAVQVAALGEAMQACDAAGIDLKAAANAFSIGNTNSGHVIRHAKYMSTGQHENPVGFSPRLRVKDINYGIEFIEQSGGQSRLGHTAAEVFNQAVRIGMGDANDSELIDALRKINGK